LFWGTFLLVRSVSCLAHFRPSAEKNPNPSAAADVIRRDELLVFFGQWIFGFRQVNSIAVAVAAVALFLVRTVAMEMENVNAQGPFRDEKEFGETLLANVSLPVGGQYWIWQ